ncbi:MAG: alpha-xylosidase [Anaerolineae bacterium]|nr:alpha-xylosidase [Anaerolineales bacterium]MCQ3976016.1 alpha-xylosidase [Anaerolineae bacterium]
MKFTDGYWHMRAGVTPHFPVHVHEVEVAPDALTVYGPTRRLTSRGATLNLPLLTVRFSSPMPNVIRVQLVHHKGRRPRRPEFELYPQPAPVEITDTPQAATLTSGRLTVRVEKEGDWRIDFMDGQRLITSSGWRGMGYIETAEAAYIHEQLNLGVGECVYGLGERFTSFVKNGQVVDLWNEDGGASSEQAYKNVPFYLTNRGYGVFVNHPELVSFEVASEKVERVQFSVPGESLDYFLIYGPSPKEVLSRYTALTGRPALPPAWSFGLWLSTSFTTDYDEGTVTSFIQGMAERDLPLHVFHFDCFWMKEFHWVNLEWDKRVFPDPEGMLKRLKARGLRVCLWINPYIAQRSALFDEGMNNGYLVKRPDGDVWQWDRWQAGMALVDFTNPAACRWFGDKLRALVDMGVDSFKTDFGERIPTEVVYFDGSDPIKMHNYYTYLYNKTVFEVLEEKLGKGQATVFARSATTGGQQFPVHWGGDNTATFESMAESLRGGLSLCLSGFGFWSHDIGGFEQTAPAEVYKRWCAFGLLSSHSRLHGSQSYRVPWLFDEEAVDVLRFFTKLKCRLMPYLFNAAREAHEAGIPTMRAMLLEFPEDPACDTLDRQYMLGESLLVAPVFTSEGTVDYYLPAGRWTHFLTGQVVEGGRWLREKHDFLSLPLMVRPNSVIAVGSHEERPDYDYSEGVTLQVYELAEGAAVSTVIPAQSGAVATTFGLKRAGQTINVAWQGSATDWQLLLVGLEAVASVEGGAAEISAKGVLVRPVGRADRLKIVLHDLKT